MRKNIDTMYLFWGLGWGGTGHGWFHYFIIFVCSSIECSMEWPGKDLYLAGTYKDLIPLFRCRYEVEHRNFLSHLGSWLGGYQSRLALSFHYNHV
jgi:hypothetical protein